eukprot:1985921-Pleurochrysis_carterae.AAC.2
MQRRASMNAKRSERPHLVTRQQSATRLVDGHQGSPRLASGRQQRHAASRAHVAETERRCDLQALLRVTGIDQVERFAVAVHRSDDKGCLRRRPGTPTTTTTTQTAPRSGSAGCAVAAVPFQSAACLRSACSRNSMRDVRAPGAVAARHQLPRLNIHRVHEAACRPDCLAHAPL